MHIRVLGCYGGSAPGMNPPSYLVNGRVAIDAGAITPVLSLQEQSAVSHVFLSHSHIDHLVTLPFLLDNVLAGLQGPVSILAPEATIHCLRENLFNGVLWPDFTSISNGRTVVTRLEALGPGRTVTIDDLEVSPFLMDHEVPCQGYLLRQGTVAVAVCSDTASVSGLLDCLRSGVVPSAVFLEASFPERLERIASLSKHLSTASFAREAARLPAGTPVYVTHMKPEHVEEIRAEIASLGRRNVTFLEQGGEYVFA